MLRLKNTQWMAMLLLLWGTGALADDVKIRPAAGNGVVVTNAAGTSERLRVNESGQVFLPALTPLSSNQILCFDSATGRIGTCSQLAGPAGPPGPAGPAGPAGPDGADSIIMVCNSVIVECNNPTTDCPISGNVQCNPTGSSPEDCNPNEYRLTAQCPAGYERLSLRICKKPDSKNLVAHPYTYAYANDALACSYTGTINRGFPTQELLGISIWCIKAKPDPCLKPTAVPKAPPVDH